MLVMDFFKRYIVWIIAICLGIMFILPKKSKELATLDVDEKKNKDNIVKSIKIDPPVKTELTSNCKISDLKVVYWFYATWCGHCTTFRSTWDAYTATMKRKHPEIELTIIDGDSNPELCTEYKIKGFPTIIFKLKDGTYKQYNGNRTLESLLYFCDA